MGITFAGREYEAFEALKGEPLDESIARLCHRVEALAPGCRTGVCIASADGKKLERSVFPNLPATFQATIKDIPMGPPYIGSCTAAMDGNTIITSHDLTIDNRFSDLFVSTCVNHGVKSLQSRPVYGRGDKPIGTFVMGFSEPRPLQAFDATLMEFAADAVGTLLRNSLDAD